MRGRILNKVIKKCANSLFASYNNSTRLVKLSFLSQYLMSPYAATHNPSNVSFYRENFSLPKEEAKKCKVNLCIHFFGINFRLKRLTFFGSFRAINGVLFCFKNITVWLIHAVCVVQHVVDLNLIKAFKGRYIFGKPHFKLNRRS